MRTLALALLEATSKFELWDDETVNPDEAVSALESVASILAGCSDEEKKVLSEVALETAEQLKKSRQLEASEFCSNFTQSIGW